MNEQEKLELVERAEELSYRMYKALMEELSPEGQRMLEWYEVLHLYVRVLTRTPLPKAMDRETSWGEMLESVQIAEVALQ